MKEMFQKHEIRLTAMHDMLWQKRGQCPWAAFPPDIKILFGRKRGQLPLTATFFAMRMIFERKKGHFP